MQQWQPKVIAVRADRELEGEMTGEYLLEQDGIHCNQTDRGGGC